MSGLQGGSEKLAAAASEMAAVARMIEALEERRRAVFAEIGEKALPELRDMPAYAELAAQADAIAGEISAGRQREADLLEEKERHEREEKERIAKLTCFACKTVNVDGSKFCESCGARLGVPPRELCGACGTMNRLGMKFCGECGNKLGEAEAQ